MRDKSGQFLKGVSGNPGGRPKDENSITKLARSYSKEAIETLVDLMRNGTCERIRGTAAIALLDRGWGKPKIVEPDNNSENFASVLALVSERIIKSRELDTITRG